MRRVVAAGVLLLLVACGAEERSTTTEPPDSPSAAATAPSESSASPSAGVTKELPRGGTKIFPKHLVVAYYGTAGTDSLGVLGEGTPQQAAEKLGRVATAWAKPSGRAVLPAFELITTVAQTSPGKDGDYSKMLEDEQIQPYLDAARKNKMLLVLDIQPGRADFLSQVKRYEKLLSQPDVGVALDPEWKLQPGEKPGGQIGHTDARAINAVSAYVSELTKKHGLPEKLFLVHQFRSDMVRDREKVVKRAGLALVIHVDGFGGQALKKETYGILSAKKGEFVNGFKLFYDEDTDLMTPAEVMALKPRPELITYQ